MLRDIEKILLLILFFEIKDKSQRYIGKDNVATVGPRFAAPTENIFTFSREELGKLLKI